MQIGLQSNPGAHGIDSTEKFRHAADSLQVLEINKRNKSSSPNAASIKQSNSGKGNKEGKSSSSKSHKKKSQGNKNKTSPAPAVTETLSPPKKIEQGSEKPKRSNSRHNSIKRRNKEKETKNQQNNTEAIAKAIEEDQLVNSLQKIAISEKETVQFNHTDDKIHLVHEDGNSYHNSHHPCKSETLVSTANSHNASPLLTNDLTSSPSMSYPPFQFMPLQPNLYPLFMPAQMQDGRFVFVPVAYPMMNSPGNNFNQGSPNGSPHMGDGSDSMNQVHAPMFLAHPEYRFFPQDGNFAPTTFHDYNDQEHYSGPPHQRPPSVMQPVFASPMPYSGHSLPLGPLPIVNHKGDVTGQPNFGPKPNHIAYPYKGNRYPLDNNRPETHTPAHGNSSSDLSKESIDIINQEAEEVCARLNPLPYEEERQAYLLSLLRNYLSQVFPDAELHPFGSTANGLGLANADMDLCVCFASQVESKVTAVQFVEQLGTVLLRDPSFIECKLLTRTRIPIIKLKHSSGLSSDIGFENKLALWNTRLLKTYSEIDPRLKKLVYLAKYWSKQRNINEPYRGTLSSYCYVLMMIFYLQQRSPPVLPCLQNIHPYNQTEKSFIDVDGHNVYFFDDLANLPRYWKAENTESVAELLLGFFHYYAYSFHWSRSVISVRTGAVLTKDEKGWTKAKFSASPSTGASVADRFWLCVEDPFELDHNLGRPANRDSVYDIRGEFIRATKMLKSRESSQALTKLYQTYTPPPTESQNPSHPYAPRVSSNIRRSL